MRSWTQARRQRPTYIAKNRITGAKKRFRSYGEMQQWYITLSIEEALAWSAWDFNY